MGVTDRIDRFQRRFRGVGVPIAVVYKFGDDQGNYLAALLAYYAFVSLLPLMLLGSTALSVVLIGHPHLQAELVKSALGQFPVVGAQIKAPKALGGGAVGFVVGAVGALYGALGAANALQYAANTVWQVPRNERPNPFAARGRSIVLLLTVGVGLFIMLLISIVSSSVLDTNWWGSLALFVITAALLAGIFAMAFRRAPSLGLQLRQVLPGAAFTAVGFRLLQTFGSSYVGDVVRHASETDAVFAVVLGLLAYLYLAAMIVVLGMEANVVRARRLWPRALLTPFTDDVDLTSADRRTYRGQAVAQRHKGYEQVRVRFNPEQHDPDPPDPAEEPEGQ